MDRLVDRLRDLKNQARIDKAIVPEFNKKKVAKEISYINGLLHKVAKKGDDRLGFSGWFEPETIKYFQDEGIAVFQNSMGTVFKF